jgi:hypothetical protein
MLYAAYPNYQRQFKCMDGAGHGISHRRQQARRRRRDNELAPSSDMLRVVF